MSGLLTMNKLRNKQKTKGNVSVTIALITSFDNIITWGVKGLFGLQITVHRQGKSRKELKAGT